MLQTHKISINIDKCDKDNIYHEGIKVDPNFYKFINFIKEINHCYML